MRRARATRWSVVMLVAILVATLGVTAAPAAVLAADEVSVVGSGQVSTGFGQFDSFSVSVRRDGEGGLEGSVRMSPQRPADRRHGHLPQDRSAATSSSAAGVAGPLGPQRPASRSSSPTPAAAATDSVAFDGPNAGAPADCDATSPTQTALTTGGVTVLNGPSDSGTVSGSGTTYDGFQTTDLRVRRRAPEQRQRQRHLFDLRRRAASRRSARSSASTSAATTRWSSARARSRAAAAAAGSPFYATFFVDDHGAYGSGDEIAFNAYTNVGPPPACLAAQESQSRRRHHRRHQRQRPAWRWQPTAGGEGRRERLHPELPGRRAGIVRGRRPSPTAPAMSTARSGCRGSRDIGHAAR